MDEPTKGIDVGSKYEIYLDMLRDGGGRKGNHHDLLLKCLRCWV